MIEGDKQITQAAASQEQTADSRQRRADSGEQTAKRSQQRGESGEKVFTVI
jgi:hypothetical protein